jgi:hypothetical protein
VGHAAQEPASFAEGWMQGIPLRGEKVFVAEFGCRRN